MKFNDQRVNSIFKQTIANLPIFDFSGSEDLVFPFEVKTGFVNTTEEGIVFNSNVTDYARYERIFTGFEAVSAIWQNSTSLLVNNDNPNHPVARKNYQPGDAMLWHFDSHTFADTFTTLAENSDYQKEQIVTTATYYSRVKIEAADVLKLYAIPAKYGKILMYIENVEEFYEPSTQVFKYAKISLRSLNDKLADTGLAIDQYVQFSCPGEGYAFPKLIPFVTKWDRKAHEFRTYQRKDNVATTTLNALSEGNTFIIREFIDDLGVNQGECLVNYNKTTAVWSIIRAGRGYLLDDTKLQNRPVVSAQFELYAPGVLSSVYAYGRPIAKKNGQGDEMTVSRYLPIDSINIPDLSQRDMTKPLSQNSSNVWIPVSRTEIESWWKDWKESVQGDKNPGIVKQWEGYLRVKTATIPEHRFWNAAFKFILGPVVNSIWGKQLDSQFPTKVIAGTPGHDDGYWTITDGDYSLGYLLNRNYFIHQATNRVPLNYTESIPWTLKNIPLVGGIASKVTLGLPIAWRDQSQTGGQNYNITGMMSKTLFEFHKNTFMGEKSYGNEKYGAVPFDGLKDDGQPAAVSPAEFTSIINFDFTDQYKATADAPVSNTQWLGFVDDAGRRYEWQNDSASVPKAATTEGYAIDLFGFHVLGAGTWKITFFALDDSGLKVPVYQGTYRTLSKLTNSVRDWSNTVKLSHWSADKTFEYRTEAPEPATISLPKNIDYSLNKVSNAQVKPDYVTNADGSIARDQFGNAIQKIQPDGTPIFKTTEIKDVDYVQPGSVQNFTVIPTIPAWDLEEKDVVHRPESENPSYIVVDYDTNMSPSTHHLRPIYGGRLSINGDIFKGKQAILKQHYDNGFRKAIFNVTGSMNSTGVFRTQSSTYVMNDINFQVKLIIKADGSLELDGQRPSTADDIISTAAEVKHNFDTKSYETYTPYNRIVQGKVNNGQLPAPLRVGGASFGKGTAPVKSDYGGQWMSISFMGLGNELAMYAGTDHYYYSSNEFFGVKGTGYYELHETKAYHLKFSELTLSKQ